MEKPLSYYLVIIAVLLVLFGMNLFFSLCETSFSSLNRIKLKNRAEKNRKKKEYAKAGGKKNRSDRARLDKASLALKLLDSYDKLLSSILIGNTFVNIALTALATMLSIMLFGPGGVSLSTAVVTIIILLFCEITPKTLAKESPEQTAMGVSPMLNILVIAFTPLNYLASAWKKLIVKIFPSKANRSMTNEELLGFVEEMREEGGIDRQEEKIIRQAVEFDDITAAEIVTHRVDLAAVSLHDTTGEIDRIFCETGFSRLPVYREDIDHITGVILLKDFHHEVIGRGKLPQDIIKPVVYVNKNIKISRLLRTMQKKGSHMAVVIDEFGGTVGIVTIEDIIEELVGEIWDEHDVIVEPFIQNADGRFTVMGGAGLYSMLEFICSKKNGDYKLPDDEIPATTISNWVLENTGRLPHPGEEFSRYKLRIRVTKVHRHRVTEVTVTAE